MDRDRGGAKSGDEDDEADGREGDVEGALENRATSGRAAAGGRPTSGSPSAAWVANARRDELEEARHDVDLDIDVLQVRISSACSNRSRREGDDHALDVEVLDDLRSSDGPAEHVNSPRSIAAPSAAIDETDDVDAVLRMVESFARHRLPDVACADDQRVLE